MRILWIPAPAFAGAGSARIGVNLKTYDYEIDDLHGSTVPSQ